MAISVAQFSKLLFTQKKIKDRFWENLETNNGSLQDSALTWYDVFIALHTCMLRYGLMQKDLVQGVVIDCCKVLQQDDGKNKFRICPAVRIGFNNGKISSWQFYRKKVGTAGISQEQSYTIRTTDAIKQQLMLRYFKNFDAAFETEEDAADFIRREWIHGERKDWRN